MTPYAIQYTFKKLLRTVGADPAIRFHDLRHACATELLHHGVSIYKVSKILGHSSVTVTDKIYGHLAAANMHREVSHLNI